MKFKEMRVNISTLLLDPNNPRLVTDLNRKKKVPDSDLDDARIQEELLSRFKTQRSNDKNEEFTQIKTLYDSMKTVGNVPIDRIVVRAIENSKKFLVIEGNRRTATLKKILKELDIARDNEAPLKHEVMRDSYENFDCILLDTQNMKEEKIAEAISLVLGLRHHGSLKEWGPLPRAYDIYKQYMADPAMTGSNFRFNNTIVRNVAEKTAIKLKDVHENLETYIVYDQLNTVFTIKPHHYSLIKAAVTNTHLKTHVFAIDDSNFRLDEPSINRINEILELEERDSRSGEENIIPAPQTLSKLGQIYNLKHKHPQIVGQQAASLLAELYAREGELDQNGQVILLTVEKILDLIKDRIRQSKWTEKIQKLLKKQQDSLEIGGFTNAGNESAQKDELKRALKRIHAQMDVTD